MTTRQITAAGLVLALCLGAAGIVAPTPATAAPSDHPTLWADTAQVSFGAIETGTTSAPELITVTNQGPGTAINMTATLSGSSSFARTGGTCASSLAAGASCTIEATYTPSGIDEQRAEIEVNASGGTSVGIFLTGRAELGPYPLRITATALDFGLVNVGSTAPALQTTVTNTSDAAVTASIAADDPTGPFNRSASTCATTATSIAAGASCTISWTASPTVPGDATGTSSIAASVDGVGDRTVPVDLRVAGGPVAPTPISISPRRLDFGTLEAGVPSAPQQVTITNDAASPWPTPVGGTFDRPAIRDQVERTGTCPATLAAGASCTYTYVVTPDRAGSNVADSDFDIRAGAVTIANASLTVSFHGDGSTGLLHLNRSLVNTGGAADGVTTDPVAIEVANRGSEPLEDLTATSDRSSAQVTDECPDDLAAGATCTLEVTSDEASIRDIATVTVTASGQTLTSLVYSGPAWTVHEAFVRQVGLDFLGDARLDFTDTQDIAGLDAGTMNRSRVVDRVAASDERLRLLVAGLYVNALGRPGDQNGIHRWADELKSGRRSVSQVAAEFYASPEAFTKAGGTNAAWVTNLYAVLLHRLPDAGGKQYWINRTAEKGRAWVALRFFDSAESRRDRVTRLYGSYLGRKPDPSGLAYWSARLTRGEIVLTKYLASSDEYLRRAQDTQSGMI